MRTLLRIVAGFAALLTVVSGWTIEGWCAQKPEVISSGVRSGRGAVAWSPDGKQLAYVRKGIELYNFEAHASTLIKADNPYFVNWSTGGNLLILHGREGRRALAVVEPATLKVRSFPLGVEADGIYPLGTQDNALVTVSSSVRSPDGDTSLNLKLFTVNIKKGALVKRFDLSRPLPASDTGDSSLAGWMQGGLHPLEFSAVLFDHAHPPKHNPYMKITTVAPDTGHEFEIYRAQEGKQFLPSGSFSPAGRRLALATASGHLRVFSMGGAMESPDDSVEGFHPTWSPGGDWIFFGGILVSTKGVQARALLSHAPRSSASWRPDGNRLAVNSSGKLWIFDTAGLDASAPSSLMLKEIRDKVKLLRELFAEEFLDEEEYTIRYNNLLSRYRL